MARYVALLRGIIVGGKNLIRMPELAACFEEAGYGQVSTYIQSGNVLFTATGSGAALERDLEAMLKRRFKLPLRVVVRSQAQLRGIVSHAPEGFGSDPSHFRYDVLFLKAPLTSAQAMKQVLLREGVDTAHAGTGVIYHSRLIARASQSLLSRLVSLPVYQSMTVRNWNTTTKLLKLVEEGK